MCGAVAAVVCYLLVLTFPLFSFSFFIFPHWLFTPFFCFAFRFAVDAVSVILFHCELPQYFISYIWCLRFDYCVRQMVFCVCVRTTISILHLLVSRQFPLCSIFLSIHLNAVRLVYQYFLVCM